MQSLENLVKDQRERRAALLRRERFVLHDQWDNGNGWVGPLPHDESQETALDLIHRTFVQRNALKEVTTRHRDSVIGTEPAWDLTGGPDEDPTRENTVSALTQWWNDTKALAALQKAALRTLYSAETSSPDEEIRDAYAPLRLFIKTSSVDETGRVPKRATLEEALADIGVHAVSPRDAGVLRNRDGDPVATRFEFTTDDDEPAMQITGVGSELVRLGLRVPDVPETVVVTLVDGEITGEPAVLPLAGRLLVHELEREPLLSPAADALQKQLNKSLTMMSHDQDAGGFVERVFLNAQAPGEWVDENGSSTEPGRGTFKPSKLHVGAGVTNYVAGLPETMADGSFRYSNPSVLWRTASDPRVFLDAAGGAYTEILKETKQLYTLMSGDGSASGASRKQAAEDFLQSLNPTADTVEGAIRWLLSTVLRLAAVLMGSPEQFDAYKPMAQVRIKVLQPTSEDIDATLKKVAAGIISRETGMSEVGIEDPDAEVARIVNERSATGEVGRTALADDGVFTERIKAAAVASKEINAADPTARVHWAHILTGGGATSAPGAYLSAAAPKEPDEVEE